MTSKQANKSKGKADSADQKEQGNGKGKNSSNGSNTENRNGAEAQELDELLGLLENANLTEMDTEAASEMLDDWHDVLQQADVPEMKELGKTLKNLKKSISAKKPKAEEIAELLEQAGHQVEELASATGQNNQQLQALAKALMQSSQALEQDENSEDAAENKKSASAKHKDNPKDSSDNDQDAIQPQDLEKLVAMFKNQDLTAMDGEAASEMLDQWHDILHHADQPELKEIAKTLKTLKKNISSKKPKTDEIAECLNQVGGQVEALADGAPHGYKTRLHELSKALLQSGAALEAHNEDADSADHKQQASAQSKNDTKAEQQNGIQPQELEGLLTLLEEEDLTAMDTEAAGEMLDHWHNLLQHSNEPEMKEIAKTLKSLKKSVTSKKPEADEIAELLNQAGTQVEDFANVTKQDYKTQLQVLADALMQSAEELQGDVEDEDLEDEE